MVKGQGQGHTPWRSVVTVKLTGQTVLDVRRILTTVVLHLSSPAPRNRSLRHTHTLHIVSYSKLLDLTTVTLNDRRHLRDLVTSVILLFYAPIGGTSPP